MPAEQYARFAGELEGTLSALDAALTEYASAPDNPEASATVEQAALRYGALSNELGRLIPTELVQTEDPEGRDALATQFVALIGLDVAVAMHASQLAAMVEREGGPEAVVDSGEIAHCMQLARDLLPLIADPGRASAGQQTSAQPIADEVDAIVMRAREDLVGLAKSAGLPHPHPHALAQHALNHLPVQLSRELDAVARQLGHSLHVLRRTAARAWSWMAQKLTQLTGSVQLISAIHSHIVRGVRTGEEKLQAFVLARLLGASKVTATCNALIASKPAKASEARKAARTANDRHNRATKPVRWALPSLPALAPLTFLHIPAQPVAAALLAALTYDLAHDYLDSDAPPPLPDLAMGVRRRVIAAIV
jgi:hypothetical protein